MRLSLAVLFAGLPALAHAQGPTQVPAILADASATSGTSSTATSSPTDGASTFSNSWAASRPALGGGTAPSQAGVTWHAPPAPAEQTSTASALPPGLPPRVQMLSPSAPLNPKEAHGVGLARRWANARYMPHADADGVVRYAYGATLATVVCAPLQVCDLALQPGEIVNVVSLGDKVRWSVLPGMSGSASGQVTHIKIKPVDAGLVSSMTIDTDRRTYAVKLVSTQSAWVPLTAFTYPDDGQAQWSAYRSAVGFSSAGAASGGLSSASPNNPATFTFYEISGDAPSWRPVRAYSDGAKTYIQFARPVATSSAPALVGLAGDGGLFSDPTRQVVNYRTIGDRYIVDQVLDRAILVSGVDGTQQKVTLRREGAP